MTPLKKAALAGAILVPLVAGAFMIQDREVADGGRLNEVWMMPASVGMFNIRRMAKEMPGAIKMLLAGKLPISQAVPPGFPGAHRIKGMDRVRNVVRTRAYA